jgi:hypothetical protein
MLLLRLAQAFESHKIPYAIVGGYAVALHGAVRGTVDVDLVIKLSKKDFVACEKVLLEMGLESRIPVGAEQVFQFREEYIQNRNLIAWSFYNPKKPIEVVDVLLTRDVSKMKVNRVRVGTSQVRIASIGDLIEMKGKAGRPQDLADIEALRKIQAQAKETRSKK